MALFGKDSSNNAEKRITEVDLPIGTNLTIQIPLKGEGEKYAEVFSTFELTIDRETFLITSPMKGISLYPLHENEEVKILYVTDTASFISDAVVVERLRKGDLHYHKMACRGYVTRNQRRNDFRVDVLIDATLMKALAGNPSQVKDGVQPVKALVKNLSAGGAALYADDDSKVGEYVQIKMPADIFGAERILISQIHWSRRIDSGDIPYKYFLGVRFLFENPSDKELLVKYTLNCQRNQLRKERL